MTIKEFFSTKNKFFWLNLLAMVVVIVVGIYILFRSLGVYTRHGEAIIVPDAKGLNLTQAAILFENEELNWVVVDSTYVKEQMAGIILDHNPQSGQKVKKGRIIYLTINTLSVPLQTVPDVADNSSLRQAQAWVLAAGFKLGKNEEIPGEKDWVYGIKYKNRTLGTGEKVPTGATLTLVVGRGMSMEEVPDSLGAADDSLVLEESWF